MSPFRPPGAFARASDELRGPATWAALEDSRMAAAEPVAETGPEPEPEPEPPPRRTGHAFYAEEARRALGVVREIRAVTVARVPAPVFHGVVGGAVALTAVLVRPQNTGWVLSACLDFALVVLTALAIIHYDLVLCPAEHRPGPDAFILPVAAVMSLAVTLAGSTDLRIDATAVLIAAAVIVAAPHLAAMRAAGLGGPAVRHLREAAPLLVCVPAVLAGAAPGLSWWVRGTVVLLGTTATAYDAGRTEDGLAWGRTALAALGVGVVLAATAAVAGGLIAQAPTAVSLLMLWHGLRGLLGGLAAGRLGRGPLLEYGFFIVLAGLVLGVGAAGR